MDDNYADLIRKRSDYKQQREDKYRVDSKERLSKIIKKNNGGILIIDYGYFDEKMKNTLQAISNQKYSNVLNNVGSSDITHNINFNLFNMFKNELV